MADAFSEGDIALLDQSARARTDIEPSAYYVVKSGNGGIIRRIHISGGIPLPYSGRLRPSIVGMAENTA